MSSKEPSEPTVQRILEVLNQSPNCGTCKFFRGERLFEPRTIDCSNSIWEFEQYGRCHRFPPVRAKYPDGEIDWEHPLVRVAIGEYEADGEFFGDVSDLNRDETPWCGEYVKAEKVEIEIA